MDQNWWFLLTGAGLIGAMILYNVYQWVKAHLPGRQPDSNQVSRLSMLHSLCPVYDVEVPCCMEIAMQWKSARRSDQAPVALNPESYQPELLC